jgi:uncharacterized protein
MKQSITERFWEMKTLSEFTSEEWEMVCDGCGLCCLNRIQDEEDDEIYLTRVACRCYDIEAGQCSDYAHRHEKVEGCIKLTPERVAEFNWLPDTCAYRLLYRHEPLPSWHPLISGRSLSLKEHGTHRYHPINETDEIDLADYVVDDY